jgi:hypothetical protein
MVSFRQACVIGGEAGGKRLPDLTWRGSVGRLDSTSIWGIDDRSWRE